MHLKTSVLKMRLYLGCNSEMCMQQECSSNSSYPNEHSKYCKKKIGKAGKTATNTGGGGAGNVEYQWQFLIICSSTGSC